MSIFNENVYLSDEDNLMIYDFNLDDPSNVTIIGLDDIQIDKSSNSSNPDNYKSLEGLVVSNELIDIKLENIKDNKKYTYFYLLDEQDKSSGSYYAKIFIAFWLGNKLKELREAISFELTNEFERLTDLFIKGNDLYAILSYYEGKKSNNNYYHIVRLDFINKKLIKVFDFSKSVINIKNNNKSSNFEGATLTKDGSLILVSDNAQTSGKRKGVTPNNAYKRTAIIKFKPNDCNWSEGV